MLRVPSRQRHPAGPLAVEADLEGILTGPWQGNVEYQHGSGFDVHDTCGRLAELHGTLAPQELVIRVVHESDANRVHANFSAPASYSEYQVGARVHCRKVRKPDVLKHAEHTELALLVDQGIIGDDREIEVQGSADSNGVDDVVLLDLVYDIHSISDLPKYGVNLVQVRLGSMGDEELAAAGVLSRMGHG